ncbi:ABC transporter permease [Salipiger sp. P9]|uniref:ABC transporter permease n=1 Tax=Salipiger pentaromativorans TaxID=2943193 RepID=UPI0021584D1F|nr:ABC transporter permease [Salipiger pentaromativorans]MCR8549210.1 ABC transporter permease [Salipiger pentaromativorans]
MRKYFFRRLFWGLVTIVVIVTVNFLILKLVPGDPVTALIGEYPAPDEYIAQVRVEFGLDEPLTVQFANYVTNLVQGDFGYSFANRKAVLPLILERAQYTLQLILPGIAIAFLLGVFLAVVTAVRRSGVLDTTVSSIVMFGYSMPSFWLGQVLVLIFAVGLSWLPAAGIRSVRVQPTGVAGALDLAAHMILPLICVVSFKIAIVLRVARASVVGVMHDDFVTTARAKGVSERAIMWKHVLPNAMVPVIVVLGYNLGHALTSSILVETVFAWPGLGTLFVKSIASRDYPVLQGILVLATVMVVAGNLLADFVAALVDPRVRKSMGARRGE